MSNGEDYTVTFTEVTDLVVTSEDITFNGKEEGSDDVAGHLIQRNENFVRMKDLGGDPRTIEITFNSEEGFQEAHFFSPIPN